MNKLKQDILNAINSGWSSFGDEGEFDGEKATEAASEVALIWIEKAFNAARMEYIDRTHIYKTAEEWLKENGLKE